MPVCFIVSTMPIQGMTGFGSSSMEGYRVEIRSLNHRFMDVTMRMPSELAAHEMPLRDILKGRFERGKFDVYVSLSGGTGRLKIDIDTDAAKEVLKGLEKLKADLSLPSGPDMNTLLEFRGLFIREEVSQEAGPLYDAFHEAVSALEEMRLKEGEATAGDIGTRAGIIAKMNNEVKAICPQVQESARSKYFERLQELLPGEDKLRLIQEAASIAEKADITEEVTRIENHVAHLSRMLSEGGAIGRKLDFIFQELNREANTVASKTDDYRISDIVIEMKAEIEKSREQAQNLQ